VEQDLRGNVSSVASFFGRRCGQRDGIPQQEPCGSRVVFAVSEDLASAERRWRSDAARITCARFERNHTYDPDHLSWILPLTSSEPGRNTALLLDRRTTR
jgi:hypothetical protein